MMKLNTEKRTARKSKAVVLFGPTAVGKTAMTEALFSRSAEIINADSVQVYRGLDIGSAKPDEKLRKLIPHHLLDIRNPWEQYTAGDFVRDTECLIPEIEKRGKIPLVTGGTGYYIKQHCGCDWNCTVSVDCGCICVSHSTGGSEETLELGGRGLWKKERKL